MSVTEEIETRLKRAFNPQLLEIIDESEKHRGHAGFREGGESHFQVVIGAEALQGMSRIARHRAIHDALGKDLMARIHALSLDIRTS